MSGSPRLGSAATLGRLRAAFQQWRGVPAAIQQSLQQWIEIVFSPGGDGDDRWHRRRKRDEHRLRVRQLAHFSGRKRNAFSCRGQREKRRQVLDVMPKARSESGRLARGADGVVAAGKFFFREPDERFLFQFGQRDALAQGKQVVVRKHGLKRDARQNRHRELALDLRAGIPDEREVNAPLAQRFRLFAGRHLAQRDLCIGVVLRETAQRGRQDARQHGRNVTHGNDLLRPFPERLHLFHRIPAAAEQVARVCKKSLSSGRELEAGFLPAEQLDTQFLFQVAQLAAHRGLRNAQPRRCAADVQLFRDGHEVAQVPEFHAAAGITETHGLPKNKALGNA